ncbi:hypothetical protein D3C72_2418000 [compost metagenome]
MWRRIAERARPVTVRLRQSVGTSRLVPRMISTTSPFCNAVRIGFSSPLILTPTAVSPTSVWTA